MLLHKTAPGQTTPGYSDVVNTTGNLDFVNGDGKLHKNHPTPSVMVTAEKDLAGKLGSYPPGTIAYTAGFADMWQKDASGAWVELGG